MTESNALELLLAKQEIQEVFFRYARGIVSDASRRDERDPSFEFVPAGGGR